mgnify:CR=1 FL=1
MKNILSTPEGLAVVGAGSVLVLGLGVASCNILTGDDDNGGTLPTPVTAPPAPGYSEFPENACLESNSIGENQIKPLTANEVAVVAVEFEELDRPGVDLGEIFEGGAESFSAYSLFCPRYREANIGGRIEYLPTGEYSIRAGDANATLMSAEEESSVIDGLIIRNGEAEIDALREAAEAEAEGDQGTPSVTFPETPGS